MMLIRIRTGAGVKIAKCGQVIFAVILASHLLCATAFPLSQSLFDQLHQFFSDGFGRGGTMGFGGTGMAGRVGDNVEFRWTETADAHVLVITPKGDKGTPLDIKIEDGLVKVSGKVVKQEVVERAGVRSQSSYLSQFSLAEGIPQGADESKGKIQQAGQGIKITFPKRPGAAPASPQLSPLPSRPRPPEKRQRKNLRDLNISGEKT